MHDRKAHRPRRRLSLTATLAGGVVLTAGLALAGCGDDGSASTAATSASTVAPGGIDAIRDPERVPGIIRRKLGEHPEIRRLSLDDHGFTVQVRDPVKRENIDDYTFYDGRWTTSPVSVSMSEIAAFEATTFGLGDVDWAAVPDLIDRALDGLDLEGEEIGSVGFDKLEGDPPRVYIGVNGLRGSGRLIANADGTNVDVRRN